jgi:hypothetical protein
LGTTGTVSLATPNSAAPLYQFQQTTTWLGNFDPGMGLVYNGVSFGNTPDQILVAFGQPQYGVGAYIQPNALGDFEATLTLFDINGDPLGAVSYAGNSTSELDPLAPGVALFIGANSSDLVYSAQFSAIDTATSSLDFAIGTMLLNDAPEPATEFLMASALIGLAAIARRRKVVGR